nr:ISLre2 family transposase [Sporolituus thermophilus]
MVYMHEGWEEKDGRRALKNPVYLSSVDKEADEFWEYVWEEANKRYDLDRIEKIYVIGDGAAWIQCARIVFPKAEFILDKFHLMKYVRQAVGGNKELSKTLLGALRFGNFEKAQEVIEKLLKSATTASRKQAIIQSWGYIRSNWEGITRIYSYKEIKCSAEGHISHVLSARMSSRPMGWSREGAKHMAYIRVCQANGQAVAEEYLRQQSTDYKIEAMITSSAETVEAQRQKKVKVTGEKHDNIPILRGPKSFLYKALRELSLAYA